MPVPEVDLNITMDGAEATGQALFIFQEILADFKPVFEAEQPLYFQMVKQQFDSEGGSSPWEPLAESTVKEKQRLGFGGMPILQRTKRLYDSFTVLGGPLNVAEISTTEAIWGSDLYYAAYHQRGNDRMPARLEIEMTPSWQDLFVETAKVTMEARLSAAGFEVSID